MNLLELTPHSAAVLNSESTKRSARHCLTPDSSVFDAMSSKSMPYHPTAVEYGRTAAPSPSAKLALLYVEQRLSIEAQRDVD